MSSLERRAHRLVNVACNQCRGWGGDGAMGSCRWVWGYAWDGVTFGRFANRPYTHTGAGMPPVHPSRGRDARFPPSRERRGNRCYTPDGGAIPGVERPSGVRRSGKLLIQFRFVPFCSIAESSEPSPFPSPRGRGDFSAFAGTTGTWCVNDACNQCRGGGGDGAMGSCGWVGGYVWGGVAFGRFANRPLHPHRSRDAARTPQQGQGCEVPAFAGTTALIRVNDACDQCKGWRGDGAMGSCRRLQTTGQGFVLPWHN